MTWSEKEKCMKHAQERAKQRYNLDLDSNDLREMVSLIQTGRAKFLKEERGTSSRRMRWEVYFKGRKMPVIYDRMIGILITVLPHRTAMA